MGNFSLKQLVYSTQGLGLSKNRDGDDRCPSFESILRMPPRFWVSLVPLESVTIFGYSFCCEKVILMIMIINVLAALCCEKSPFPELANTYNCTVQTL